MCCRGGADNVLLAPAFHPLRTLVGQFKVGLMVLLSVLLAAAAPAAIAKATGTWVVEFENERCTAAQAYSDGTHEFVIGFEPTPTLETMDLIVQVPTAVHGLAEWRGRLSMGNGKWSDRLAIVVASTKPGHSRYRFVVDRKEVDRLLQTPDLRIEAQEAPRMQVRLTNFSGVMTTLKDCEAGLLALWGLSRETQKLLATFPKPKGPVASFFKEDDFPSGALSRDAVGTIEARVTINVDGRPVDCHIMQTSGHKDLDEVTCAAMVKRGRFMPGQDKSGRPLASPYVFRVTWAAL